MPEYKVYKRIRLKANILGLETHLFSVFVGISFLSILGMIAFNFSFKAVAAGGIVIGIAYVWLLLLQHMNVNDFLKRLPKIISK